MDRTYHLSGERLDRCQEPAQEAWVSIPRLRQNAVCSPKEQRNDRTIEQGVHHQYDSIDLESACQQRGDKDRVASRLDVQCWEFSGIDDGLCSLYVSECIA